MMRESGLDALRSPAAQTEIDARIPVRKPTFGVDADPSAIKATWLGCVFSARRQVSISG